MLQVVVVTREGLTCIERRVEIAELHLIEIFGGELRQLHKARQSVERITSNKQIIGGPALARGSHSRHIMKQCHLAYLSIKALTCMFASGG